MSVRAAILGHEGGNRYEMFDVASVDAAGARLVGPLLLEIGEEVTLRLSRGDAEVDVRARVTAVERTGKDAVSVVRFAGGADLGRIVSPA
jgi:hypothetical protein